ncbi:MAG: VanW family protein [Leptospiraceae bacterium]|nr:VanW family protein [Leptospiraceae bacterium]
MRALLRRMLPYALRRERLIWQRHVRDWFRRERLAQTESELSAYTHLLWEHSSRLRKQVDPQWEAAQQRKKRTLELAVRSLHSVCLRPGETFSFWRLVGRPARRRGYPPGLMLIDNRMVEHTAGGLCQLSNGLYWMAVNLGLPVTERHRHTYDLFPDDDRRVPFGAGATVVYNYRDLQFTNPTGLVIHIQIRLTDEEVIFQACAERPLPYKIRIQERDHAFYRGSDGKTYRTNRLVSIRTPVASNAPDAEQVIALNTCEVLYPVEL